MTSDLLTTVVFLYSRRPTQGSYIQETRAVVREMSLWFNKNNFIVGYYCMWSVCPEEGWLGAGCPLPLCTKLRVVRLLVHMLRGARSHMPL